MPELLEVFDQQNHSLGITKNRRLVHEDGDWHRTAQVYVLNERRDVLCNLRHPCKDVFPSLWDISIGGHLSPGETYEDCAYREMEEELGVAIRPNTLYYLGAIAIDGADKINGLIDREHAAIFMWRTTQKAGEFSFQSDEISELRFFPLAVVRRNLQSDYPEIPFIPLREKFLQILTLIEEQFLKT